jgi:hypothetical protein
VANPGFSDWPGPLSLAGPRSFRLKLGFNIMGRPACLIFNALRQSGIITPTDMVLGITFLHTLGPILWDFDDLCMLFWRDSHRAFWRNIRSTRHDV